MEIPPVQAQFLTWPCRKRLRAPADCEHFTDMFLRRRTIFTGVCALLLGALVVSCRTLPTEQDRAATRTEIQNRVTNRFPNVVLLKPANSGNETPPAVQLAPLLLQEVRTTNSPALWLDQPAPATGPPRIQVQKDIVLINNHWHWQWSHVWHYPGGSARAQGVRLTLDSKDAPVVWEVLSDTSGQKIIYVSQALEQAARAEFGPPLSGRRFSIERSLTESPDVVVANAIEDGPMAMGPILYLQNHSHDVLALICRCMPAQFQDLRDQRDYELLMVTTEDREKSRFSPERLEQRLRLPSRF